MAEEQVRKAGWEIAQQLDKEKTPWERLMPDKGQIMAALYGIGVLFVVFLIGCWLAGNPFEFTQRIPSDWVKAAGWTGTNEWAIIWSVVWIAMAFEFMDATAGMGFGTAITPLLLVMGFNPKQIVPVVMIQQGVAGLIGTFLHAEYQNVEWKFKPMSETIKLWFYIAIPGMLAVAFSVTAVYAVFKFAKVWITLYVCMLLLMMGVISLYQGVSKRERKYRPKMMIGFATLAGFNKGIGGGGYGPVVTIGGLLAGVPAKSMMAVTAISEGTVSTFSIIVWLLMLSGGVVVDYLLLPSMMIATILSAVVAPWATRVFPEKIWQVVVPFYSVILAFYATYKAWPDLKKILG
ncbi:MAG TPA: sulfite exporter TauE/SafE family protein [Desulfobacterales bacterium]|nr:sulfite exporter TauE/SafE family protein [Desulfobacterales bacterium]